MALFSREVILKIGELIIHSTRKSVHVLLISRLGRYWFISIPENKTSYEKVVFYCTSRLNFLREFVRDFVLPFSGGQFYYRQFGNTSRTGACSERKKKNNTKIRSKMQGLRGNVVTRRTMRRKDRQRAGEREVGKKLKYETGGRSYQMLPCSTVSPRCLHPDPSNSFLEDSPI